MKLECMIFDLDNTLYSKKTGIQDDLGLRIQRFISKKLRLSDENAREIRKKYWKEYGNTARGLKIEYGISPVDFFLETHQIDISLYEILDLELKNILNQTQIPKYIFTNSPREYSILLLKKIGIYDEFTEIFDIEYLQLVGKPNFSAYESVINAIKINPQNCVMIDDALENLVTANRLGMKTILVGFDPSPQGSHLTNKEFSPDFYATDAKSAIETVLKNI
jgi:putative hydrolase of the HAD superfamily